MKITLVDPKIVGNGKIKHAGGVYTDWIHPGWVSGLNHHEHFHMENGILTVNKPGIYFVYAQVVSFHS